ncbi:LOW QUALITY PROTEIN: peptidyl-prolyl cis-trans isomerase FKBP1A-like [Menidia menidia]
MGVQIETISPGDGRTFPKKGQTCVVHYVDPDSRIQAPGWFFVRLVCYFAGLFCFVLFLWPFLLCSQMSVGQRATLTCSPDYAYGNKGHPGIIPPNATLIFDVELLGLE